MKESSKTNNSEDIEEGLKMFWWKSNVDETRK